MIEIDIKEIKNRRTLVVQATEAQLNDIKEAVPQLENNPKKLKLLGDDIYRLELSSEEIESPAVALGVSVDELQNCKMDNEYILDFEGSEEFYKKAASKNGFTIISDEYSDDRNAKLYKAFNKIETGWRVAVASDEKIPELLDNDKLKPRNHRKGRDHLMAQYELSEFFEIFFFSTPTDKYLKKYWQNDSDKSMETALVMTRLTRADELKIKINREDSDYLRNRRNACMHFRTTSPSEYIKTVNIINEYLMEDQMRILVDSAQGIAKSIQKILMPSLTTKGLAEALNSMAKSTNRF